MAPGYPKTRVEGGWREGKREGGGEREKIRRKSDFKFLVHNF